MKKTSMVCSLLFLMALLSSTAFGQKTPASADRIMEQAKAQAKAEHKNIFLIFHASWCGWCKKMDGSMQDPATKDYFDKNFVIKHITVHETGDSVVLENPGGQRLLEAYGGGNTGIPYWLIFDQEGKLLADSKMRKAGQSQAEGQNIGCPSIPAEVDAFIAILKKTSSISDAQAAAVRERFLKNAPVK
jgi:thioredoxin-related protein